MYENSFAPTELADAFKQLYHMFQITVNKVVSATFSYSWGKCRDTHAPMNELPTSEIEDKEIGGAGLCKATKTEAIQITLCLIVLLEEIASGSLNIAKTFF